MFFSDMCIAVVFGVLSAGSWAIFAWLHMGL